MIIITKDYCFSTKGGKTIELLGVGFNSHLQRRIAKEMNL